MADSDSAAVSEEEMRLLGAGMCMWERGVSVVSEKEMRLLEDCLVCVNGVTMPATAHWLLATDV